MGSFAGIVEQLLPLVVLVSIRVGVALAAMPAPFGTLAPTRIRAALGLLCAFAVSVPLAGQSDLEITTFGLLRAGLGELMVGAVIGLTVRVTLAAAEMAGTFAGFSMGLGFAQSVDPMYGERAIVTSRLLGSFAALIFLILKGHHVVLTALAESLRVAPPGDAFGAVSEHGVVAIGSNMMAQALRIAAPVVATMFIVQIGTGLISRAVPRVHIFTLSFAVASGAGALTLFVAAPSLATAIATEIGDLPDALMASLGVL